MSIISDEELKVVREWIEAAVAKNLKHMAGKASDYKNTDCLDAIHYTFSGLLPANIQPRLPVIPYDWGSVFTEPVPVIDEITGLPQPRLIGCDYGFVPPPYVDTSISYTEARSLMGFDRKCICPAENFTISAIGCKCGGV